MLRKLLQALGLSEERVEELLSRIEEWLQEDAAAEEEESLPYRLRDDFLSAAELSFYRVLQTAVGDSVTILTKVSLGDLFYAKTGDFTQNRIYRNKIDRKHVDFLLCDPLTLQPLVGIELDDKSHQRPDRQARDAFVNQVFAAADLTLIHIPVRHSYPVAKLAQLFRDEVAAAGGEPTPEAEEPVPAEADLAAPLCPRCGGEMVERVAKRGARAGQRFWGCRSYPRCRSMLAIEQVEAVAG